MEDQQYDEVNSIDQADVDAIMEAIFGGGAPAPAPEAAGSAWSGFTPQDAPAAVQAPAGPSEPSGGPWMGFNPDRPYAVPDLRDDAGGRRMEGSIGMVANLLGVGNGRPEVGSAGGAYRDDWERRNTGRNFDDTVVDSGRSGLDTSGMVGGGLPVQRTYALTGKEMGANPVDQFSDIRNFSGYNAQQRFRDNLNPTTLKGDPVFYDRTNNLTFANKDGRPDELLRGGLGYGEAPKAPQRSLAWADGGSGSGGRPQVTGNADRGFTEGGRVGDNQQAFDGGATVGSGRTVGSDGTVVVNPNGTAVRGIAPGSTAYAVRDANGQPIGTNIIGPDGRSTWVDLNGNMRRDPGESVTAPGRAAAPVMRQPVRADEQFGAYVQDPNRIIDAPPPPLVPSASGTPVPMGTPGPGQIQPPTATPGPAGGPGFAYAAGQQSRDIGSRIGGVASAAGNDALTAADRVWDAETQRYMTQAQYAAEMARRGASGVAQGAGDFARGFTGR